MISLLDPIVESCFGFTAVKEIATLRFPFWFYLALSQSKHLDTGSLYRLVYQLVLVFYLDCRFFFWILSLKNHKVFGTNDCHKIEFLAWTRMHISIYAPNTMRGTRQRGL